MKVFKKSLSIMLSVMMLLAMFAIAPVSASAQTTGTTVTLGSGTMLDLKTENGTNYYSLDNGSSYTEYTGDLTVLCDLPNPTQIYGNGPTINVHNGTHNIIFNNTVLGGPDTANGSSPFIINNGATVNLTLYGTNKIWCDEIRCSGITLYPFGKLVITEESTGNLTVDSGYRAPGIGGLSKKQSGTFIVNGGTITAYGSDYCSAIGGGENGDNGTFEMNGGTVYAYGGHDGAGIGGGSRGDGGNITITGGTIYAYGGSGAAGIGGGYCGLSGDINISGGVITAVGGSDCDGIGCGKTYNATPTVNITGGVINGVDYNN